MRLTNAKKMLIIFATFFLFLFFSALLHYSFAAYEITDARGLQQLASTPSWNSVELKNDIDLTDVSWNPIENFTGTLDGKGYHIIGMNSDRGGLFENLSGTVKNLGFVDCNISNNYGSVGAIANYVDGDVTIENCSVSGQIKHQGEWSKGAVGGIIGSIKKSENARHLQIEKCYNFATITSDVISGRYFGCNM